MATIDKPLPNVDNDKAQEEIVEIENKKAAEVIDTPTGPVEVAMDEMGGAEVSFDPNAVNIDPTQDHFANLAETLDDGVLDDRSVTIDMADNGVLVFHGKDGSSVLGSKDDTTPTAGEEAWGDVTGATAALGGASSEDMFHYSNSSLFEGITLAVAYVPSGGTTEEESSVDYGVEYTNDSGLTVGFAMGENNADADASIESTILYANMVLDAFTIGATISEADSETANADTDFQAFGISFAATEELSMSINTSSHDYEAAASQDQDALGVSVSYVMGSMTLTANHNTVDNIAGTGADDRSGYNLNLAFAF